MGLMTLAGASCRDEKADDHTSIDPSYGHLGGAGPLLKADLVVYGATPAGIIAAVEAASNHLSVVLIGGWRERHLGGMMSGGLGWTDILDFSVVGGRARDMIFALSRKTHAPANPFAVEPPQAEGYFQHLLRSAGVPVYWSTGVAEVHKAGAQIVELVTHDALRARGRVFIDASYEGDLMAAAGVSYRVGREQADTANRLNGFRGLDPSGGGGNHQLEMHGRSIQVDPFIRAGDPSSGLLYGVRPYPNLAVGSADQGIEAYTFRLTMAKEPARRLDLPAKPPIGYDRDDFEVLFRYLDGLKAAGFVHGRDWTFEDHLIGASRIDSVYDINARGGFSTDPFGLSWGYPTAANSDREAIWKAHETALRGFFYALSWEADPRVPLSLRQEVKQWGLAKGFYEHPYPGDTVGWPYQLYVREARRLEGEVMWTGADLRQDGAMSAHDHRVVALASYREDSHHVQRLAAKTNAGWTVWNEGNLEIDYDSTHSHSPIPYGVMTPRRGECTNLLVPFCISATHQAFSAIRTEPTAMALGQASGAAAALVCQASQPLAIQDVPYSVLHARLSRGGAILAKPDPFTDFVNRLDQKVTKLLSA